MIWIKTIFKNLNPHFFFKNPILPSFQKFINFTGCQKFKPNYRKFLSHFPSNVTNWSWKDFKNNFWGKNKTISIYRTLSLWHKLIFGTAYHLIENFFLHIDNSIFHCRAPSLIAHIHVCDKIRLWIMIIGYYYNVT